MFVQYTQSIETLGTNMVITLNSAVTLWQAIKTYEIHKDGKRTIPILKDD